MPTHAHDNAATPMRQALLMAAGLGTRLRPLTDSTPKPLIRVGGRPILEWSLDALPREIEEAIIVVGYLKEQVMAHFGDEWRGRRIRYVEQAELKGTGHAVAIAAPLLQERFMVLNGDDLYMPADLQALSRYGLALLTTRVQDKGRFGAVETDAGGYLRGITEDGVGEGNLICVGAYALDRNFLKYDLAPIKGGKEFGLPQTVARMTADHRIAVCEASAWLPIGFPEDIAEADRWIEEHRR